MKKLLLTLAAVLAAGCAKPGQPFPLQNTGDVDFVPSAIPPEYCLDKVNKDEPTCFASAPAYCEEIEFAKAGACRGSTPLYCADEANAAEPSCQSLK